MEDTRSRSGSQRSATIETRPAASETPLLEVEVAHLGRPRARVVLTGQLHEDAATQVRPVFANAVRAGYTEIEVDVGALSSFDVAGLDVLESAQRDCAGHGGLLVLLNPPPMLRRVLGVTGLGWLLHDWRT